MWSAVCKLPLCFGSSGESDDFLGTKLLELGLCVVPFHLILNVAVGASNGFFLDEPSPVQNLLLSVWPHS